MGGYLERLLAAHARAGMDEVELAMVRVPDYTRASLRGAVVHVSGYSRMGPDAMQAHLTTSHGMQHSAFGKDFAHPQSLAAWHGGDHVARGGSLSHAHLAGTEEHADHVAHHLDRGGDHHGGALRHFLSWEALNVAHREGRREADRQVRRRLIRVVHRHGSGARRPGASGAPGASSGASGSSGGSGGSGSSGGSSGSSGSSQ